MSECEKLARIAKLDENDKAILKTLQSGIPLVSQPFAEIANKLGVGEEEVLLRIKQLLDKGVIRRFRASIGHRQVGITANAMIVWKVPRVRVEEVGRKMAEFKEVTHCYERRIIPGRWEYNVFSMVHGRNKKMCKDVAEKISEATGINDYVLIFSEREFKKTGVRIIDS